MGNNANATRPAPRLTADIIANAERILSDGNRVELMPDKGNGVRVFEITRREQRETRQKRRLTAQAQT